MLNEEICKLRDKLNKSIENEEDYAITKWQYTKWTRLQYHLSNQCGARSINSTIL